MQAEQDEFLEKLYRQYLTKLTVYANASVRDRSKAQDIVQDVFHEAVAHIDDLMAHENPGGWLMNTTKNKIYENRRAHARYIHRFLSLESEIVCEIASSKASVEDLCTADDISPVKKIERALSQEEFYLLKRLVLDNASHLEVSQELGITVWTSQKRLERIRKKLLEIFPEHKNKK